MKNGGIIGPKNNTSSNLASGVWSLREQYSAIKNNIWPTFVRPNAKSLLFNSVSTNGYVNVPSVSSLESLSSFTIEAWVKRLGPGDSSFPVIIAKSGISADFALIYRNASSAFNFRQEFSTSFGEWQVSAPPDNVWYHVAVTFNVSSSNNPIFYINGLLHNTEYLIRTAPSGSPLYSNGPVTIGNRDEGIRGLYGYVDEVRVWNVVRTPQEIQENYNKTIPGNSQNLVGYWSFEEGEGSSVADLVGNSDGTITNDALFSNDTPFV